MARGKLTKELIDNAGNVADKVADWLRKEDEAQKWAHEKFPEHFGPKSTPQERATFAGIDLDDLEYHTTDLDGKLGIEADGFKSFDKQKNFSGLDQAMKKAGKSDRDRYLTLDDLKDSDFDANGNLIGFNDNALRTYYNKGNYTSDKPFSSEMTSQVSAFEPKFTFPLAINKSKHFDYNNPDHVKDLMTPRPDESTWSKMYDEDFASGEVNPLDLERIQKGQHNVMEDFMTQMNMKKRGYTGTNMKEPNNHDFDNATTTVTFKPELFRSPLAHFDLRKLGLGGAGAYMSTNLMASPNDIDLAQGIHDRANERRQGPSSDEMITKLNQKRTEDLYDYSQDNYLGNYVPGTNIPYVRGGKDSQDYSYGGQLGIPGSDRAYQQQWFKNNFILPDPAHRGLRSLGEFINDVQRRERKNTDDGSFADAVKKITGAGDIQETLATQRKYSDGSGIQMPQSMFNSDALTPRVDDEGNAIPAETISGFWFGESGNGLQSLGRAEPLTTQEKIDTTLLTLDLPFISAGAKAIAKKGVDGGMFLGGKTKEGVKQIADVALTKGSEIADVVEASGKVANRLVKDTLDSIKPNGPRLAYANADESKFDKVVKDKTNQIKDDGPLKADIYLDDQGNNFVTGQAQVVPEIMKKFDLAIDDAVKTKERELGRALTELETRKVYDEVTAKMYGGKNGIKQRTLDFGSEKQVLRRNGEGRTVLQEVDEFEFKNLNDILKRDKTTIQGNKVGKVLADDFNLRNVGDEPWNNKAPRPDIGEIDWTDAVEVGNLERQIGERNVKNLKISLALPRVPKKILQSDNPQEVADYFRDVYTKRFDESGSMDAYASHYANVKHNYQSRAQVSQALVEMARLDALDGGGRLRITNKEVADEVQAFLKAGGVGMVESTKGLMAKLADSGLPERSKRAVIAFLNKQAKDRIMRNKISKFLDDNLDLVPGVYSQGQAGKYVANVDGVEVDGKTIGEIVRALTNAKIETRKIGNKMALQALKDSGRLDEFIEQYKIDEKMDERFFEMFYDKNIKHMTHKILDNHHKAKSFGKHAEKHKHTLPKDHPLYESAEAYSNAMKLNDEQVIYAVKGLNPNGKLANLTVNKNTTIHEAPGHLNQELAKANSGGSPDMNGRELNALDIFFKQLKGNANGKGPLHIISPIANQIPFNLYQGLRGEVGARKTAENAKGMVTVENLADPKSAVDYHTPITKGKRGWKQEKQQTNYGEKQIENNPSRVNYALTTQMNQVLKELKEMKALGKTSPEDFDKKLKELRKDAYDRAMMVHDNYNVKPESNITPGYEFTETGGLLKPKKIDLSEHIGDEMISLPWDGTARGTKITKINDHYVDADSHGGHQFLDDKGNIARGYIGASNEGVIKKILDRIWLAHKRSLKGGGTGRVIMSTVDMQKGGEAFAETPAITAIQVIDDGSKQAKKQFNKEFKNLSASMVELTPKNWGKRPFEGLPDIQTQEFEDIMLGKKDFFVEVDGKQKRLNPSKIRKALWGRMSNAGTQKLFKYNWDDLQDAQLRADKIVKGHVGNRMIIVNDPSTIKAVENQDPLTKNVYDTALQGGDGVGTLDIGAQPEEIMFPERFRQAYDRLKKLYPNRSHEQLKDNARGILSDSTLNANVYSETITGGLVDNVYKPTKTSVTVPKSLLDTDSKSLWDYPDQKYTSANTSINKTKTAEAFTKLLKKNVFKKGSVNLDIGGGRFDNANDLLKDKAGAKNIVYDPFNRTKAHNAKVAKQVSGGKVDTVTINNTLNVIEDTPNQIRVLEQAKDAVKADGKVYISVYQGDKSGVGRTTSKDSFQQMKPLADYLETVQKVFPDAKIVNGMIEATK
jgi:hypothetical protein